VEVDEIVVVAVEKVVEIVTEEGNPGISWLIFISKSVSLIMLVVAAGYLG
jgi:hypothetical protein